MCLYICYYAEFQWLDVDMISGVPMDKNAAGGPILGSTVGPVPIIRLYGCTSKGNSVLAHIHGVTPYFYVLLPPSVDQSNEALIKMRHTLDQKVRIYTISSLYLIYYIKLI